MPAEFEEGPGTPYISYGERATFIRQCPECARYVKADETARMRGIDLEEPVGPNATCKRHGRVSMPFVGFF